MVVDIAARLVLSMPTQSDGVPPPILSDTRTSSGSDQHEHSVQPQQPATPRTPSSPAERAHHQQPQQPRRRLRVLTVGDGDLSLSVALARCYGASGWLDLTASTLLPSADALCAAYPTTAAGNLRELALLQQSQESSSSSSSSNNSNVSAVLYNVNASRLHTDPRLLLLSSRNKPFDLVSFHHPHLGDCRAGAADEAELLQRHAQLLAHYLHSAEQLLSTTAPGGGGRVHVALCANQAASWQLRESAERVGLQSIDDDGIPVQRPFHQIFPNTAVNEDDSNGNNVLSFPWDADPNWQPPPSPASQCRRTISKRHGGSRHWLGKFGYRHVRTFPSSSNNRSVAAPNLTGSRHYVFRKRPRQKQLETAASAGGDSCCVASSTTEASSDKNSTTAAFECAVCLASFATEAELQTHWQDPASPLPVTHSVRGVSGSESVITAPNDPPAGDRSSMKTKKSGVASNNTSTATASLQLLHHKRDNDDGTLVLVLQVGDATAGKRLRWSLQHLDTTITKLLRPQKYSNSDWNRLIKDGGVSVNGAVAVDTGRILQLGWTLEVRLPLASSSINNIGSAARGSSDTSQINKPHSAPALEIIDKWNPLPQSSNDKTIYVVWKPVGMRAIGSFDAGTLEESFSRQMQQQQQQQQQHQEKNRASCCSTKYTCLSPLDTGCSGLCVLAPSAAEHVAWLQEDQLVIVHTFTALVHGHVPEEWMSDRGVKVELPVDAVRRWKKQAATTATETNSDDAEASNIQQHPLKQSKNSCIAILKCIERTITAPNESSSTSSIPALSTVTISTNSRSSRLGSIIATYLRNVVQHPVVGDRVAVTEYLALPRSMRNRVKQRFCLGCTRVDVKLLLANSDAQERQQLQHATEREVPEKWSAGFWHEFCSFSFKQSS